MKVTVLITSYNDRRIINTLESLIKQTRKPDEIFVADGGTKWDIKSLCEQYNARFELIPGNVVQTRNKAIKMINSDIVAFIDTDEVASTDWLKLLTEPIENGSADFTGGPAKHLQPRSRAEDYVNKLEDYIYNVMVPRNIMYLPMGNSAWKKEIFDKLGGFDENIWGGSEDYDINMRAIEAGYRGIYISEAYVIHDHSDINSYGKLLKKRYSYLRATAKTYIKNGKLMQRSREGFAAKIDHPFYIVETMLKPIALLDAIIRK